VSEERYPCCRHCNDGSSTNLNDAVEIPDFHKEAFPHGHAGNCQVCQPREANK
jgi:hypothetical protein